ncbi:hypothetical protein Tco_0725565 [Tanacetum coccineum]|uniref:Uncharacterized protein n=1 Tax=Tanacetum coccineum TaxID=301880 RepID=A0ABQ4YD88_9ASTR
MSQPANDEFSQHLSDEESNHEDASDTGAAPKQQQQMIPQTTTILNIKLLILKKEEYDIWAMEMEHYLEYIDNEVWKVIQNGNSKKRISTGKDGIVRVLSPVTAAEIQAVEKERKAKNILLMAIPKEHMRRFHGMDDAKEIWEAIRTRFGGNAIKEMQKAVSTTEGSCGNTFEHSLETESESLSVQNEMSTSRVAKPVWTNANRVNHVNQFVPRSVQLNAGRPKFNYVRPTINTGRTNINSGRPKVNTVSSNINTVRSRQPVPNKTSNSSSPKRPKMNQMNQRMDFSKSYSSVRRPFAKTTAQMSHSNAVMGSWGSVVKTSASYNWRNSRPHFHYNSGPTFNRTVNAKGPQGRPKPAKASGTWTCNKGSTGGNFEEFNGGHLLPLEVEMDYLSGLVVSSDFKMPDENQILLKVPRHTISLQLTWKGTYSCKGFDCLIAKANLMNLNYGIEDKPNVKGVGYRWMFDIDYLTDSMNYIPVSLENQANPHAGTSENTNNAAVQTPEEIVDSRTSSTKSRKEKILTAPQQEEKVSSTDTLEDNPKIQAFRRDQTVNTGRLDHDDSSMPELEIFHKSETRIFDEASYDEDGVITDFNSLPTEIEVTNLKRFAEALQMTGWVQAMQEELLQFKLQQVGFLVDLPIG